MWTSDIIPAKESPMANPPPWESWSWEFADIWDNTYIIVYCNCSDIYPLKTYNKSRNHLQYYWKTIKGTVWHLRKYTYSLSCRELDEKINVEHRRYSDISHVSTQSTRNLDVEASVRPRLRWGVCCAPKSATRGRIRMLSVVNIFYLLYNNISKGCTVQFISKNCTLYYVCCLSLC